MHSEGVIFQEFGLVRNQFHCHEAFFGTSSSSVNSGKLKTKSTVSPGMTVVGRLLLTKGLLFEKIIKLGAIEIKSCVLFFKLNIHIVGH